MVLEIIAVFLATSLSFFLFYFSVPYRAGSDMAELSSSGIWRAFYRFLSKIGYLIHRLCETVYNALPLPKVLKRGAVGACTNLLFYVVILYLLTVVVIDQNVVAIDVHVDIDRLVLPCVQIKPIIVRLD